ncbi:MAG: hypothetical protein ACXAEF_09395 [Candidatus Thorarchaeota archaeon]|jgi:hypothetical protein
MSAENLGIRWKKEIIVVAVEYIPCKLCVDQEVARLLSLSMDLGIEPQSREDVRNMIRMFDYSSLKEDKTFVENIIDAYLDAA